MKKAKKNDKLVTFWVNSDVYEKAKNRYNISQVLRWCISQMASGKIDVKEEIKPSS